MIAHFKDQDFQFGLEVALGCTYRQAADVGEVLATASRITDGDADSWVQEWTATAGASWTAGCLAQATGRRVSAVAHYRRAATYHATALYRISHATQLAPERELEIWRDNENAGSASLTSYPSRASESASPTRTPPSRRISSGRPTRIPASADRW